MLHNSQFNMRSQFYNYSKLKDLGYANGWKEVPDIVKACKARKHIPEEVNLGRCLNEYRCWECGYKYKVDSSG